MTVVIYARGSIFEEHARVLRHARGCCAFPLGEFLDVRRFLTANITRTAIGVVLLSILPAIVIVVGTGVARYMDEVAAADARGERFVRAIASRQEQMTEVMETFVLTLGHLRDVRGGDMKAASALFRNLLKTSTEYINILLLDADGEILTSALPMPAERNPDEYAFFKDLARFRAFGVGRVVLSPFKKVPALYFAAPVHLDGPFGRASLCVALNLAHYEKVLDGMALPETAAVLLVDGRGMLAAGYPKQLVVAEGEKMNAALWDALQKESGKAGSFRIRRDDAAPAYNVAYRSLTMKGSETPYFHILYVEPEQSAYAHAKQLLAKDIGMLAGVVLLALAAALGLCYYTVRRPWRALLDAAARVGRGEADVRVPENGVGGEIGLLIKEFNAMAGVLDKRDAELFAARDHAEFSRTAKGEFLANMSHEIRTSMNAILGMAYLVLKTDLTAQQRGYISKLLAAANALLRVINDILDFSKMEAGKMAMENISFSLRRILGTVRSEAAARLGEKKLGFDLQISPGVPDHLIGDPLRLSQSLMILVDDALNRSERGIIALSCSVIEQEADRIILQFAVRDAGVGLTPTQLSEMRQLFENEEEEGPTTLDKARLRLAIANRLFRMMGGLVMVSSVFGEGVLFTARAGFGYAAGELRQPDRLFEGKKALIVDGSEVSRQDLVEVLTVFGFQVECAADADQALELLTAAQRGGAPFVIVFMDWRPSLVDMASQVFLLQNAPLSSPPPLVLTTAAGRADLPPSLNELEIDALLPKPINESLVFDTIMNLLGPQKGAPSFQEEEPEEARARLEGLRVLLAEDNAVNQQIAGEILESENVLLTIADNGEEAVRRLTESPPGAFDLVLMDLQMPVMDGFAATRAIRKIPAFHLLRLPIIAMTAHSDVAEITACLEAGMNDHTGKPIVVDKFLDTIRRWLPVSPEAADILGKAAAALREAGTGAVPSANAVEGVLDQLVPVLHEGRMEYVRTVLWENDATAFSSMVDALSGMADDFAGGGRK